MLPDRRRLELAKVGVEDSNPFARSIFCYVQPGHIGNGTYLRLTLRYSAGACRRAFFTACDSPLL